MKHHKKRRTLHRTKAQRVALLKGLARSLVLKDGITTTIAKAKELRPFAESLVTEAKKNSLASRRIVATRLGDREATKKLHETIVPRYATRRGGYTRIVRLGRMRKRVAEMAKIEFV